MPLNVRDLMTNRVNGSTFISIDTETRPILRGGKENPHVGRVRKVVKGSNVMVFQNKHINAYDALVKRRLAQEGKDPESFVLSPRRWGRRLRNEPFVEHNGGLYLEVIFLRCGKVQYFLGNKEIPKHKVIGLVDHDEAEQGGLDNKVIIRTYMVRNIKKVRVDHEEFIA